VQQVLLAFPDFSTPFYIYTDASDYQLGIVIVQNSRSLAFFSHKLMQTQCGYTVSERELLVIIETLREFHNMLYGMKLIIHTDYQNLIFNTSSLHIKC
jgi:hypothetical protein